jgi:hypothetical protein
MSSPAVLIGNLPSPFPVSELDILDALAAQCAIGLEPTDPDVAVQQGAAAGGSQAPVVNRRVRASMLAMPHLRAVDR